MARPLRTRRVRVGYGRSRSTDLVCEAMPSRLRTLRLLALAGLLAAGLATAAACGSSSSEGLGQDAESSSTREAAAEPLASAAPPGETTAPPAPPSGETGGATSLFDQLPGVVRETQPSIVTVLVTTPFGPSSGSGVIWSKNGLIVTNSHVVAGADTIEVVLASGERVPGTFVADDPRTDLAIVRIKRKGLPKARFSDGPPQVGQLAIAMGSSRSRWAARSASRTQ